MSSRDSRLQRSVWKTLVRQTIRCDRSGLLVNDSLKRLLGLFSVMYVDIGRPWNATEKLLQLQVVNSVRGESLLVEQRHCKLLFRCPVGLTTDDAAWGHPDFSKNDDWLLEHDVVQTFFTEFMFRADKRGLLA